ncbi:MAG: phosphatidylglycerol lysyltransferase domain-containing protein [Acetobacteraceae bacterium]
MIDRFRSLLRTVSRNLPALLGVVLLVGAIYVVQKEFRHLKMKDIGDALSAISTQALVFSFIWTVLSYFILTFYDRLGTVYAGHKVSYGRVAFASFCAYSLSHNLGFAAVSGAAVRFRLYAHWGLTPLQIGKIVAFCSLTFALGGMVLGGAILFIEPYAVPFFGPRVPVPVMYAVGALLWAIVIGYVTLSRLIGPFRLFGHEIELPGARMAVVQVILATVDVAVTATIFYALLPDSPGLTWTVFLGVYVASYTAGLAANLPGGIGVFDTAMLFGLEPYLDAPHIVGAIVVFRLYYYIIPLFLAGAMFAGNEILLRGGSMLRAVGRVTGLQSVGRWSEPDFAVTSAASAVVLCGILLLGLGVIVPSPDYSWLDPDYAQIAAQASQFVPSLIGAGLLVMAIGLAHRVMLAWGATIILLILGTGVTAAQDSARWVAGVLVVTTLLLAPFRTRFYRHARLLSGPLEPSNAVLLLALLICLLAIAVSHTQSHFLSNDAWWAMVLSPDVSHSVRLVVAMAAILALTALWLLVRPGRVQARPWDETARRNMLVLGRVPPGVPEGVVMGEAERAAIAFRRVGPVLLALGDPVGAEADRVSAIWRFRDYAHQEGLDPAVWRAGPGHLKIYSDLGLTALPLGPDGLPLPEAPDETPQSDHYLVCVAERDLRTLLPLLPDLALQSTRAEAAD